MAAPTNGQATQVFIDLLARVHQLTPDLPTTMLPVLSAVDIEKISLCEATMVPTLSTLLLLFNDTRSEITVLSSTLEALDTHTRTLSSTSQVQGAVQEGATLPISNMIRDLSHRVAGAVLSHPTIALSSLSTSRTAQTHPPRGNQCPRPQPPNPSQPKQGMDPDVPRYDLATKTV